MYYERPASELVFLTKKEHRFLHRKGKKWSEQIKRKISDAMKNRKLSEKHKRKLSKPVLQIDKQTGEIVRTWSGMREVQRVLGIAHQNISKCCLGKYKSAGGYVWRYAS